MGHAERIQERPDIAAQASTRYGSRGVPDDWFLDPADPGAGGRYREDTRSALDDQATAFLAAHEALAILPAVVLRDAARGPSSLLLLPGVTEPGVTGPYVTEPDAAEPAAEPRKATAPEPRTGWIDLPSRPGDFADEGELGWQSDALCAQTDPEAFFPEKGGSTRDAKKVCGSCMVKSECLEYALENDERFGIWGGLSERERRRLRKRAV
ncbi:WhiB family transcriptional regulator [Arthrobacter sp. Br18]|uniref:WhiB family transcriptional regulator n=1 Tax=Arthrobacter sp. Br18 TaxID=1312954 RepID=UPI0004BCBFEA|nr:WhiB family transcriptional regulator [Arthrobacter sp. Br18]